MNEERRDLLLEFAQKLGYEFKDIKLLNLALTHCSVSLAHNERLEFLGDAVLSLVMAEEFYKRFPDAREGDMSRMRSSLVKGETLTQVAKEFNLNEYLRLGSKDLEQRVMRHSAILEDAVEAVVGAVFLDSDFYEAKRVVLQIFADRIGKISLEDSPQDPKSALQEFLQRRGFKLPRYRIEKTEGAEHNQMFHVICRIEEFKMETFGKGRNRKSAEQDAAAAALQTFGGIL